MVRVFACAAFVFGCAALAVGQGSGTASSPKNGAGRQPPPGPLRTVTVKGNHLYPAEAIIAESGLRTGQRVDAAVIEQARKKIQDSELFNNVADEYRFEGTPPGYALTFSVVENEQLFPMRFERLDASADQIREYLKSHVNLYSDQIPGTQGILKRYTAAVQDFLREKNASAKVRASISNDDPQQLTVVFTPDAPAPTISQVVVSGNQAVDTGAILRAVNQVAIGVPLSDARLNSILDGAIKPLYAAKGYAAVSFPKVETEPAKNNLGVVVKVQIQEGPLFKYGSIRFRGNGMDEEEIRTNIPFKPGQGFNSEQVDNFRLDLVRRMKRRGLLDAEVSVNTEPDDAKHAVNITYNVVPGGVYNFRTLDIQGLDITTQPVIAKLWGEKAGHPFNPEYPDFFLKRVQQQGLFDNLADTHSDYTSDPTSHDVTVHLYFKGGQSNAEKMKQKKEEDEKRKSDGTWSPWPFADSSSSRPVPH